MNMYEEDDDILMHCHAHFGGKLSIMREYYAKDGKGALLDEHRLHELEDQDPPDPEKIEEINQIYQQLREICELKDSLPKLIAELILSEEEEEEEAIKAIVAKGEEIVPYLIDLLNTPTFADPLYPGYGQALALAANCLGKIGDPRAITPLFEVLDHYDPHTDQSALDALIATGESAKTFLINVLKGPITRDTENAALALSAFPEDPKIANACLELLQNEEALKKIPLSSYLALGCAALNDKTPLQKLINHPQIPEQTKQELLLI